MGYGKYINKTTLIQAFSRGRRPLQIAAVNQQDLSQEKACQALKERFDKLELSLAHEDVNTDIDQLQKILADIAQLVQSEANPLLSDGYTRLLNRLIRIYTQGIDRHDSRVYTATAANYADVIEAISQAHPDYDYSEAVGHLLHYMNRLYRLREEGWLRIFEHLVSMPDSIRVIQLLKNSHLNEIQRWIEEGVHNLFQLRDDQLQSLMERLGDLKQLEEQIELEQQKLENLRIAKVVPINSARQKNRLESLVSERDQLIAELDDINQLVELLEENIREFEDKLFATRRACLIHPV